MRAMVLEKQGGPLKLINLEKPSPKEGEVLLKVVACGICRTDLHIMDGELKLEKLPIILGHQIVGIIESLGKKANRFKVGIRVGGPWLGKSCGHCKYCISERENLCDEAIFTGYSRNGGFAEYVTLDENYLFPIPSHYKDAEAAPLLCAGFIGYRALKMVGNGKKIGFYGFGSAAHLLAQLLRYQKRELYAFTREKDVVGQNFARKLGAKWAGSSTTKSPEILDGAIIFAPVGELIPIALENVAKGGKVVSAGIHMSDIPSFPYHLLWGEKCICSVANLTRKDGEEFLKIAEKAKIETYIQKYPLEKANEALHDLRKGKFVGSAVLIP
ncbi:MAG: zinc-dependent alcohol dehydrogenase family protein [Chlamydiae bacterium]|nr:zinc-dependent alcohol dehydrogenase family protein [Chlamydiota bacterium]